jgi:uncharacterized protein (TIGR02246 family)
MTGSRRSRPSLDPRHNASKNRFRAVAGAQVYRAENFERQFVMPLDSSKAREFAEAYADAWCSKSPEAVAAFYARDGHIGINRAPVLKGRAAIAEMAAGFYSDFPDLVVRCDDVRTAGHHAVFLWTLEGHHARTKAHVCLRGWEEWEIDEQMKIRASLGWFDVEEYERQIRGGA